MRTAEVGSRPSAPAVFSLRDDGVHASRFDSTMSEADEGILRIALLDLGDLAQVDFRADDRDQSILLRPIMRWPFQSIDE